jgi:hypothetical protein
LRVLPFYLCGATAGVGGAPTLAVVGAPDAATQAELRAKWPVATLDAANHPAGKVVWPSLVIGPRTDSANARQPAYVVTSTDGYQDGFAAMSSVLGILHGMMAANGESPLAVQYAPIIGLDGSGAYSDPGGGLGGGDAGTGDYSYVGIFIHEQGHAFGLPHAGEAYDAHEYPYFWGSLDGSAWGYDTIRGRFLAPFIPPSASTFAGCANDTFGGHPRAMDTQGRCVKQDPMQSGAGDQSSADRFATFSDYNTAGMQHHLEGTTTVDNGAHAYSGGKAVRDPAFASGYKRWDGLDHAWVAFPAATTDGGLFGLNQNLPVQTGVPVASIVVTVSHAGTAGATQIYPPIAYTGNLTETIDPTSAADLAKIVPDTSVYYWYCRNGGCDYTLRVTYQGGAQQHVLIQGGFRPFNQPTGTPPASASDPLDGNSFQQFVVNVPARGPITKIELLDTPMVWNGMPVTPAVLATRSGP